MARMLIILKTLWEYWKKFGKILGKINTTIILSVIYYLIISPIGLIKQLVTPKQRQNSYWLDIKPIKPTLEESYQQYSS